MLAWHLLAKEVPDRKELATLLDTDVDREVRVHQSHLVPETLCSAQYVEHSI
eukprot:COSAG05_NODE_591_length_8495_cov_3436.543116_3_plen_52_part_00